jgi:hypothetical protein
VLGAGCWDWRPKGEPAATRTHDFPEDGVGMARIASPASTTSTTWQDRQTWLFNQRSRRRVKDLQALS